MKKNITSGQHFAGISQKYRINFLVIAACLIQYRSKIPLLYVKRD